MMLSVLLRLTAYPLWYLLVMMLSVLRRLTAYPFGIFWSWCCLYFCVDSLPLWYLLVMMLSVLLRLTAYPFGIFWSWCCLYFFDWQLTSLVSFGHDVVCTSIDGLLLWYLLVMMLSVLLRLTAYPFGIFWSWCCLYFFDWRLIPLVSFGHDAVCTSSIDGLPLWYLLVMMLSVLLRLTAYPFGISWSWCFLYFSDWRLTPLVYFGHDVVCTSAINGLPLWYLLVMMLSVLLRLTAYPFGIFWSWWRLTPLVCVVFGDRLTVVTAYPLVSSIGHDVVCTSSIDGLPLWYLLVMMLSVLRLTAYPFGISWSWCCLYFGDWRLTPLVSFGHDVVCSVDSLPLWYLLVMMLSVLLRLTAYPFGIFWFWSWCCLYFFDCCLYFFDWLTLWYLLVMMLSVLLRLTAYPFGIFWSWCCLYFCDWQLTPLVSFGHDVVCTSSIDGLPFWYLLVMMYLMMLVIFWLWCCLYFDWRLTIFWHDVVCTSYYPFGIFWSF